jgi:hypothetical protein
MVHKYAAKNCNVKAEKVRCRARETKAAVRAMGENQGVEKENVVEDTVVVNPSCRAEEARDPQKSGMTKQNNEWNTMDA